MRSRFLAPLRFVGLAAAIAAGAPLAQAAPLVAVDAPHLEHTLAFGPSAPAVPLRPLRGALPPPTPGPDAFVYGYLAYWDSELSTVPWDELSHLAIFSAGVTTTGQLTSTNRWNITADAVAIARTYNVKVHLCVTNFEPDELTALLGSSTARATLVQNLRQWVNTTGADGVNIDFERMPASRKSQMIELAQALHAEFGDEVVYATPAVDWSNAWDYGALSQYGDLFIMGYAYHYTGSSQAGPNDPLYGRSPWNQYSLDWTVRDYLADGVDPARIILGLPLYGHTWPVGSDAVPASTTGSGSSLFWRDAAISASQHGRRFDAPSDTPWFYGGGRQGWYSDTASTSLRVAYAVDEGIGGVGFWALNYDDADPLLWQSVRDLTHASGGPAEPDDNDDPIPPSGAMRARAGNPILAYPGDTIRLNGTGSTGSSSMTYDWAQVGGPAVTLTDPTTARPSFEVPAAGTYRFSLVVAANGLQSAPDEVAIIALDPRAGKRHQSGCATAGGLAGSAGWLLAVALLTRRRRTR